MNKKVSLMAIVLVSLYIGAQCVADVAATRMIWVAGVALPGGTLMFALTFTLRDMLHKKMGRRATIATVVMGAAVNVLMAGYLLFIGQFATPPFYTLQTEWGAVFAWLPSITFGSILAEMLSQWVDTEVYELWVRKVTRRFQWSRVVVSNAFGLTVDSIAFGVLSFSVLPYVFGGDSIPLRAAVSLGLGQMLYKGVVTIISIPLIYTVKDGDGLA